MRTGAPLPPPTRLGGGPRAARGRRAPASGKKTPEVIARLEALMAHETAGDPVRGLKWTRRTTAKIAELRTLGIDVCARTVARLLKTMGFSLRVNARRLNCGRRMSRLTLELPGWRPGDCHLKFLSPGSGVLVFADSGGSNGCAPRIPPATSASATAIDCWFPRRNVSYRLPYRAA